MTGAKIAIKKAEALTPPFSPDDLKAIRASFGMSQSQFARLLRVEKSWLYKREQGATDMSRSDTAYLQLILHLRAGKSMMDWVGGCS